METPQGQPSTQEPAALQGQPAPEPAGGVPPALEQFVVTAEPAAEPNAQQGQPQGQTPQLTGQTQPDHFQSLYNRTLAEKFRLEQELQLARTQQQVARPQVPEQSDNPYNPQTQPNEWWAHEKKSMAELSSKLAVESITNLAMQSQRQQYEANWQMAHPQIPIDLVKGFGRQNGLGDTNLDAILTLMTLPQQQAAIAQTTAQNAINQFRQPQTGATPVRGGSSVPATKVGLSYEKLANEYNATNGRVYETWPAEVQKLFDQETSYRASQAR